ncbi:hypothetical protein [Leclercia sp.]|uniref:WDGH domain-containing protein n=1 Tax=Leclercia sp. TaxID=1898428 RepID=UPI0028BE698B|nr:hypothetical protein [Leclercia sp.]
MTTENLVTDTEADRIEQYKRDTLHSLLIVSMEQQGPQKFTDLDVKAIAKKVSDAYDHLGNNYTVAADPTAGLVTALPGGNVMNMRPGSDASKTAPAGTVALGGSSFSISKKDHAYDDFKGREPEVLIALPAGAGQTLKPWESSFNLPEGFSTGQISDGYHTFEELYAHRVRLFSALMNVCALQAWWSRAHHDGSVWEGWILAGIDTPAGTVTYHLPESEIPFLPGHTELPVGKEWDGHTADDVLERLKSL